MWQAWLYNIHIMGLNIFSIFFYWSEASEKLSKQCCHIFSVNLAASSNQDCWVTSVCQDAASNISFSSAYLLMTTKNFSFLSCYQRQKKKLTAQHTEQHTQHTLNPLLEVNAQLQARLTAASELLMIRFHSFFKKKASFSVLRHKT